MEQKSLELRTEKELRVYMHPTRQKILHYLSLAPRGMTAKQLADLLEISPSSAGHHLASLEQIGMVEIIRTEKIHGLTAKFYKEVPATVSIKAISASYEMKHALLQNVVNDVFSRWTQAALEIEKEGREPTLSDGDFLSGVLYLSREEAEKIGKTILEFVKEHSEKKEGRLPYEFALISYAAKVQGTSDLEKGAET